MIVGNFWRGERHRGERRNETGGGVRYTGEGYVRVFFDHSLRSVVLISIDFDMVLNSGLFLYLKVSLSLPKNSISMMVEYSRSKLTECAGCSDFLASISLSFSPIAANGSRVSSSIGVLSEEPKGESSIVESVRPEPESRSMEKEDF